MRKKLKKNVNYFFALRAKCIKKVRKNVFRRFAPKMRKKNCVKKFRRFAPKLHNKCIKNFGASRRNCINYAKRVHKNNTARRYPHLTL